MPARGRHPRISSKADLAGCGRTIGRPVARSGRGCDSSSDAMAGVRTHGLGAVPPSDRWHASVPFGIPARSLADGPAPSIGIPLRRSVAPGGWRRGSISSRKTAISRGASMPRRTWPLPSFTTVTTIRSPIMILSPSLRDRTSMEDSFPGGFAPGEYGSPSRGLGTILTNKCAKCKYLDFIM